MKKNIFLLLLFYCFFAFSNVSLAQDLNTLINQNDLSKTSLIAISVRDVDSEKLLYAKNENILINPASCLKIFTTKAALSKLGYDYNLNTILYKDNQNNLYIKLAANPLLTDKDLENLITSAQPSINYKINSIFLDASIIDDNSWGIGWMQDDNVNPYTPKFNAFNLNQNLMNIKLLLNNETKKITIIPEEKNQYSIIDMLTLGKKNSLNPVIQDWVAPDLVYLKGSLAHDCILKIPTVNQKKHFQTKLTHIFTKNNIEYNHLFLLKPVNPQVIQISQHSQNIKPVLEQILTNSNNLAAETIFKLASAQNGSFDKSKKIFIEYFNNLDIDTSKIELADASGVSRNNLLFVDFETKALVKIAKQSDFSLFKTFLATPQKGTLRGRLQSLNGKLYAKTGTLKNISTICGYLTTAKGKNIAFAIAIQNYKASENAAKFLENQIIENIYNNF